MGAREDEVDRAVRQSLLELSPLVVARVPVIDAAIPAAKRRATDGHDYPMSDVTRQVLEAITRRPSDTNQERCATLKVDRNQEYRARKEAGAHLGLIEEVLRLGRLPFFGLTDPKGIEWARHRGLGVDKFTSSVGISHWICERRVVHGWGTHDRRMAFSRGGVYGDVRADGLAKGPGGARIPFQISVSNSAVYEAGRLVRLARAEATAGAVLFAVDAKKARAVTRAIERELAEQVDGEEERARLTRRMMVFEMATVLASTFEWNAILDRFRSGRDSADSGGLQQSVEEECGREGESSSMET